MFEKETELIIKLIIQHVTPSTNDAVAIKDILAAEIPHPIKTFFRADIEAILLVEQQRFQKTSRFNFNHHEVQSLQRQINSILVLNYTLNRKEFELRLNDAVHMIINYLVRPQWTLTSVLFEKERSISSEGLLLLLRYFGPYEYLKEIISHYFREKQQSSITKDDFKILIWKIDGKYLLSKTGDEVVRLLQPLFEFFDFQIKTGNNSLPIKALIKFFEDKGLANVIPRLEGEIVQGKTELNRFELSNLLDDVRRTLGAFQFERIEFDDKDLTEKSIIQPSDAKTSEPNRINIELGSFVSESDKRKFIKKIFYNNEQAYNKMLNELSRQTSWKQASKYIDETFIKNNVDPYSSEATKFIEILFNRFHPKK